LQSVTVMRADLVAALREEAVRAGARIRPAERLDGAALKGGLPDEADLVVGADGIWSTTRGVLDPAAPKPSYAGIYHVSGISEGLDLKPGAFNMIFARHGAFIFVPAPDGTVWWSAQVAARVPPDLKTVGLDELATLYRTEKQAVAILRAARGIQTATLGHVLAEVPRRYGGRIVLVGDAAHPVGAGQGASMAIEDAVVLARQLQQAGAVAPALASFDLARRARTDQMARAASANRDAKTAGPIAGALRNLVMPIFFRRFHDKATRWLYTYDLGTLTADSSSGSAAR
jgi:salicylate hydroxylase